MLAFQRRDQMSTLIKVSGFLKGMIWLDERAHLLP